MIVEGIITFFLGIGSTIEFVLRFHELSNVEEAIFFCSMLDTILKYYCNVKKLSILVDFIINIHHPCLFQSRQIHLL